MGLRGENTHTQIGGVRCVVENMTGRHQTDSWWCRQAKDEQAKVFRAHAVPQDLCGNLINALKLLANQQEDGDGLIQNIVTNLCEGSRKGLTEGLGDLKQVDNHLALEVGHLREGVRFFKVRRPKVAEGNRGSAFQGTLRAEEEGTWKSCINVDNIAKERLGPPLVDADWHAFCHALYKGIEGEDWGQVFDSHNAMSRAVGIKKPKETQNAKALWKMKAAKEVGEEYYDPKREDNILGRKTH